MLESLTPHHMLWQTITYPLSFSGKKKMKKGCGFVVPFFSPNYLPTQVKQAKPPNHRYTIFVTFLFNRSPPAFWLSFKDNTKKIRSRRESDSTRADGRLSRIEFKVTYHNINLFDHLYICNFGTPTASSISWRASPPRLSPP